MGCLKCISLLLLLVFISPGKSLLFHSDIDGSKDSLLLHSSNGPSTSAPIGPLGLETTVSLLAMEITRLQADMKARDDKMKNFTPKDASRRKQCNNILIIKPCSG